MKRKQKPYSYWDYFADLEKLEKKALQLPKLCSRGTEIFPLILSRQICVSKELVKLHKPERWQYIPNNNHVMEELGLLKRDIEIIGEEIAARRRQRR